MNWFRKSLLLLCLWVIIGVGWSGISNFMANTLFSEPEIPVIGDDTQLIAGIKRKVQLLDKLTCGERYKKFEDIYKVLQENYYTSSGSLSFSSLLEWWLHWFVGWLKDPHTVYFDKQENDDFSKDLKWSYDFEWIGAVIGQSADQMIIMEIIKGSPAHLAWLKPLDTIVAVDGKSVDTMNVRDVVNLVRGPKGTSVELTLYTEKDKKITKITIVRNTISIPSVYHTSYILSGSNIGYINISTIGEDTHSKFKQAYNELLATGVQGIILDLRWNWWGLLPVANELASYFIPKNKIVTITRYKSLPEEVYYSQWYSNKTLPVAVLVDELTASASEILAYALKYHIGASLVGSKTFGKGTIQTLFTFTDNASIKFTIGKRFTPDNQNIDKIGIKPNFEIPFDSKLFESKQIDNQLEKAKALLVNKIISSSKK